MILTCCEVDEELGCLDDGVPARTVKLCDRMLPTLIKRRVGIAWVRLRDDDPLRQTRDDVEIEVIPLQVVPSVLPCEADERIARAVAHAVRTLDRFQSVHPA